jgi:glucan phosphoethanolaminetransferase (alkaline phosphatase superfamily)
MRTKDIILLILLFVAVFATVAACRYAYFPGDVTVERFVQSLAPKSVNWALWITKSAAFPWNLILLAITFFISWGFAGWRIALFSILSFAGMLILGTLLSPNSCPASAIAYAGARSWIAIRLFIPIHVCLNLRVDLRLSGNSGCPEEVRRAMDNPAVSMLCFSHNRRACPHRFRSSLAE